MNTDNTMRLGYACINETLKAKKIRINRTFKKATLTDKGIDHAAIVAEQNLKDLYEIIRWNAANNIRLFRMTSDMFSWGDTYGIENLPNYPKLKLIANLCSDLADKENIRLTFHPGQFNCLGSPNPKTVQATIKSLNFYGQLMDFFNQPRNHLAKINIHLGGVYGDKQLACSNFIQNFAHLDESVRTRLTLENDDKASMYSVKDLYERIYDKIGVPIVFDYHHHSFCTGDMSEQDALEMALSTWRVRPCAHYSESATLERDGVKPQAHSRLVYSKINSYGHEFDCVVEAKGKELAVLHHRELFGCE
jgi:UV DNA damage endonuclease